ncbi:alpha/beta hydrolase [Pseudomonas putida]|uniref:alpha/beta hydrolase n=1 Tax=Pseudomonas putida TaxID=303 RepID=UPI001CE3C6B6|nr:MULTISPECIES: alpha/beta hydrolase [Pseudomonas]MDZ5111355.1 alpha/beta hydrolase [Pseudomonas putida]
MNIRPTFGLVAVSCALLACTPGPHGPATGGLVAVPSVKDVGINPTLANIAYGNQSASQRMDLYRPEGVKAPPVLIYIHGGGFRFGTREMASAGLVKGFLAAGYAVLSIDYRLSTEARFPAAVQDVFSAMAYVKAHAAELQIDPGHIAIYGESAGANLASLVGVAYDNPLFMPEGEAGLDLKPMAVIAHYPPVNFLQIDPMLKAQECPGGMEHNAAGSFESLYLGGALPDIPDRVAQADPRTYVTSHAAPFFIQNGDKDCMVGAGQSLLLVHALQRHSVPVHYQQIPGASHGGPQYETPNNISDILAFLDKFRPGT